MAGLCPSHHCVLLVAARACCRQWGQHPSSQPEVGALPLLHRQGGEVCLCLLVLG